MIVRDNGSGRWDGRVVHVTGLTNSCKPNLTLGNFSTVYGTGIPNCIMAIKENGLDKGQKWYGPNRSRRYSEEMARIHRRTVKKDLHDPDNHNGVITHREPDILECEVKWALGSITTNKASGGD